jgi:murein DD-endopeptidase MepM/ murein hydrolase activator NlpD
VELKRRVYSVAHPLGPTVGDDVRVMKHGLRRYESNFFHDPPYDRTYGLLMDAAVRELQRREGFTQRRYVNQETFDVIWANLDAFRRLQYRRFKVPTPPPPPTPPLVYPFPLGAGGITCQGIHYTAGLSGNVAIDFCAPARTPILCVEGGVIQKLSGHDPGDDTWDAMGVYGWSVYVRTKDGLVYYYTHFGTRAPLIVGQRVRTGEALGRVGDQKFRPDHTHIGVTHPLGYAAATKRIKAVAAAPRVAPVL